MKTENTTCLYKRRRSGIPAYLISLRTSPATTSGHSASLNGPSPNSRACLCCGLSREETLEACNDGQSCRSCKPRRGPNTQNDSQWQQHLGDGISCRKLDNKPRSTLAYIPETVPPPQLDLLLRLDHILPTNPALALEVLAELLNTSQNPGSFGEP